MHAGGAMVLLLLELLELELVELSKLQDELLQNLQVMALLQVAVAYSLQVAMLQELVLLELGAAQAQVALQICPVQSDKFASGLGQHGNATGASHNQHSCLLRLVSR